jgi:hypothetical protein
MATSAEITLRTYSFTLTLAGIPEIPAELAFEEFIDQAAELMDQMCGRLLAVGCDDASLSARGEIYFLGFDREAASLGDAVGSAIRDVERAGFRVALVEIEADADADASHG